MSNTELRTLLSGSEMLSGEANPQRPNLFLRVLCRTLSKILFRTGVEPAVPNLSGPYFESEKKPELPVPCPAITESTKVHTTAHHLAMQLRHSFPPCSFSPLPVDHQKEARYDRE